MQEPTSNSEIPYKTSLLLLDPHESAREALAARFERQAEFSLLGSTGDTEQAIEWARLLSPRLLLVDPHRLADPDAVCRRLLGASPASRLVYMTPYFIPEDLPHAARLGAAVVLIKGIPFVQTVDALRPLMV